MLMNSNEKDFLNILQSIEVEKLKAREKIHITVITNINLEPIFDTYLTSFLLKEKITATFTFLDLDEVLIKIQRQDLKGLNQQSDYILIFPNIQALNYKLFRTPNNLDLDKITEEMDSVKKDLKNLLNKIRSDNDAIILWYLFELPYMPSVMLNLHSENNPYYLIKNLNTCFESYINKAYNSYFIDLNTIIYRFGAEFMYDRRQWHWSRSPYSKAGYREMARYTASYIFSLCGKNKKCLVLDCDEVLWGGILGEEGIENICLSPNHPGSTYYEFQQEILNLYNKGILIAICSKNNESDVMEALQNHPYMLIKEHHLAAYEVNWDDKATNLIRIANRLNIGLDSLVFMDDSEWEVDQIQNLLPEIKSIHLPRKKPYLFKDMLLEVYELANHSYTEEDKRRTTMYRKEQERSRDRSSKSNMDLFEYFKSLKIKVEVSIADDMYIPRVAQLTQKTNQFNLRTIRCTEDDIRKYSKDELYDVIIVKMEDRFGDLGVIGTSVIKYKEESAEIEHFILSCRALGRSVEDVMLKSVIQRTKFRGVKNLYGTYVASPKNDQTRFFYANNGFQHIKNQENNIIYHCNPSTYERQEEWREWIDCSFFE